MTACVNRKHTKKVAAVVTASLVGALSLGAAPVAAMADTGIDLQFTDAATAFSNGEVEFQLYQGSDPVAGNTVTYKKNAPVHLDVTSVKVSDDIEETVDVTVTGEDYETAVYAQDEKGNPTGDPIEGDITKVGKYVAVVTAVSGDYEGGSVSVKFEIEAQDISAVEIEGNLTPVYDATEKTFTFALNGTKLTEGIDYTVKYVYTGNDASDEYVTEVKDAGTYRAIVEGIGNYDGSVQLTDGVIDVQELDLSKVYIEDIYTSSSSEPTAPDAIWINNTRYAEGSAILDEVKAELTTPTDVYFNNGDYGYTASAKDANDPNIKGEQTFTVHKVAKDVTFTYDGAEWPVSYESFVTDADTKWDTSKVKAEAADGTEVPVTKVLVYNEKGQDCEAEKINWSVTPGTYTIVYTAQSGSNYGGKAVVTLTVWADAVDADASAMVAFDQDGDGEKEVVTSISTVYDGNVNLYNAIDVTVKDDKGNELSEFNGDYEVSFYNADGIKVTKLTDAGTYTLKVTSSKYKLSGTTEMTITIAPKDISTVKSAAVTEKSFDRFSEAVSYLPYDEDGYTIDDLQLQYLLDEDTESWAMLPMNVVRVTIVDSEGNEVKKVTDEGVYTVKFEARNDDAANNYVIPDDLTITCIKSDHLLFADVEYTDYFADPVAAVANSHIMNGYSNTKLFGSEDQLTRGQVACILFNLTENSNIDDETDYKYTEDEGYITGFSDVNGKEYYGKAIAWAKQAGVVNGYGDGTFKPDQAVTREEFAAMLANYASKYDQSYSEADTSVLDQFDDAASVSDWATEVVAWAVKNGVMGNGGFLAAQSDIIRADAACMVYNYALAE